MAAYHFYKRFRIYLNVILSEYFGIDDFWFRLEFQMRGSPHVHGLFWFALAPKILPGFDESPEIRSEWASRWGDVLTALNPDIRHRTERGQGDPLALPMSNMSKKDYNYRLLADIVNYAQKHGCSSYCQAIPKDKAREARAAGRPPPEPECKGGFPHPLRESAGTTQRAKQKWHSFAPRRNDPKLNAYNRTVSFAWLANTDLSPCTNAQAVVDYAGKYASKSEKKSDAFSVMSRQVLPGIAERQPLLSFITKFLNKFIGERDYSQQECCHLLLRLPLHLGSRQL